MPSPHPFHGNGGAAIGNESLWPERPRSAGIVFAVIFMAFLTALFLLVSLVAFSQDDQTWALLSLYVALLCGHAAGIGLHLRWRPFRRMCNVPTTIRTGTSFRYSVWAYYWFFMLLVLTIAGMLPVALAGFGHGVPGLLISIAILLAAAFLAFVVVTALVLAPGRLILTPDGLHHRGLTFRQYSPWSSVTFVDATFVNGTPAIMVHIEPSGEDRVRNVLPRWIGIREQELLPLMAVRDQWLATDPAIVYQAVRHYHANPQDREELGTQAAVDRIRQHRLPSR